MPDERDQDESDESSRDEERDEDQVDETEADAGRARAGEPGVDGEAPPETETPRNRAERRAAARRERRGAAPDREAIAAERVAERMTGRPRVPPKTQRGRSSADEVAPWAKGVVDWMTRNRSTLVVGAAAVVVVAAGAVGWTMYRERRVGQAAAMYFTAAQTFTATVRAADAPPDPVNGPPRRGPTYPDATARARAAADAFRRVDQSYPNTPVAPLAKLGQASALYQLGRYGEAKGLYQSLLNTDLGALNGRVVEGLAFALEATNDLQGALRRFQELARMDDGTWRDEATYHQARLEQRLNNTTRARDLLRGMLERVNRAMAAASTAGTDASVGRRSIDENARALLREIEPSDPLAHPPASSPNAADPEAIMRMLQQQTGQRVRVTRPGAPPAGGGTGGAPAPQH